MRTNFKNGWSFAGAAAIAMIVSTPAMAAELFTFDFSTVTPLIGGPGSGSGTITTNGTTIDSRGFRAQMITGIRGTFNGFTITGLATPFGANNLFYVSGPSFVDGSGLGFMTNAGTAVNLFFQSSASSYRINTTGPFTSSFVNANSAAVVPAVPEPSTWAMMLLGFGGMAVALRSRRRIATIKARIA